MQQDDLIIKTTTLVAGGAALGQLPDGRAVFVDGGAPNELVSIELTHEDKKWAKARITKILDPSPSRIEPLFPASALGGAMWAHLAYETQLKAKEQIVRTTLQRIGKLKEPIVQPIIPSPQQWRYRNRIELTFGSTGGKVAVGFLEPGSNSQVVVTEDVALFDEVIRAVIARVNQWAQTSGLSAWQPGNRMGELRNLLVRRSLASNELVINLTTTSAAKPDDSFARAFDGLPVTGVTWSICDAPTVLHDLSDVTVLHGSPYLHEEFGGQRLRYHVMDFFQVNPPAVELLLEHLKTLCHSERPRSVSVDQGVEESGLEVIDLYAGVGLLGLTATTLETLLTLVESHPQSTKDAMENVRLLGRENTTTVVQATAEAYVTKHPLPDGAIVIVDPPRSGLDRVVVDALNKGKLSKLIYVSCDPATLARDLNLLSEKYQPVFIQPFDFFPQTPHVETLVELLPISLSSRT